jgi:hypothetical protein
MNVAKALGWSSAPIAINENDERHASGAHDEITKSNQRTVHVRRDGA